MQAIGSQAQLTLPLKSTQSPDACEQKISLAQVTTLKAFELDGVLYLRVIPGKKLFQSTMVHEVVNRGDIFAVRLEDSVLTIVPGKSQVTHYELSIPRHT
jgi:hypothetical protein